VRGVRYGASGDVASVVGDKMKGWERIYDDYHRI